MGMDLAPKRFADTVILAPAGRLDHATAGDFQDALTTHLEACAPGRDRVVLDLGRVEYIASVGLRALMVASRQVKAQGGTLVVAAMRPVVEEIFQISKFTLVFQTFPSVRDALAALSPSALAAFDAA